MAKLHELDVVYGSAYPGLSRAIDLIKLGVVAAASDELHEAYVAWRWAARRGPLRAGRVAIYRGKSVVVPPRDMATLRARLQLDQLARELLAQIASALGDVGMAVKFGGRNMRRPIPSPTPTRWRAWRASTTSIRTCCSP